MGRPDKLPEPWHSMAEHAGGLRALGAEFLVHGNTIVKWSKGSKPHPMVMHYVNEWALARGIMRPWPWQKDVCMVMDAKVQYPRIQDAQ